LEEVDNVQTRGVRRSLGKGGESKVPNPLAVLRVVRDEDFDKEHADKVAIVVWSVDRYSRIPLREDSIHHLLIEDRVGAHREDVFHGRHDIAHWLFLEVEDAFDDVHFICHKTATRRGSKLLVKCDQGLQLGYCIGGYKSAADHFLFSSWFALTFLVRGTMVLAE
jgi:hypothetical protein